ncbi:MAG: hypothetical protein EBR82_12030 [Caulobacteraceae bacterium]|nr:hypothetical protein [Caulobacteraceae bacterium]
MSDFVCVLNKSGFPLEDGYNGTTWLFRPEIPVKVPVDVARHIFGYEVQDKAEFVIRLNWVKTNNDLPAALERLSKFEISPYQPEQNRSLASTVGQVTPILEKGAGRKATIKAA